VFLGAIVATIVATAGVTYSVFHPNDLNIRDFTPENDLSRSAAVASRITPTGQLTSPCPTGNWSAIYEQYEALGSPANDSLGSQYLNSPQFMSFLSQYLNMSDPVTGSLVQQLLNGSQSVAFQQALENESCSG
jgi:hypothetical protein